LKKHNKETYKDVKSFRPFSVLNSIGNIFEKILYDRLMWVATSHKWFGGNRHDFLPGKSTVSAMHSMASVVETSRSNRKRAAVVVVGVVHLIAPGPQWCWMP
jgi:hypothetical protein